MVPPAVVPLTVQERGPFMKRESGLHPARPEWLPPTKQPQATLGGLIAASVTNVSPLEGSHTFLRTSPPMGGIPGVYRTFWRISPRRHACGLVLVLGSKVHGYPKFRLVSQSSAGLSMQPYPRAPGNVWPGDLHGMGCFSAWAMNTGFPIVAWCVCLSLGLARTPPILAGVCGIFFFGSVFAFTLQILADVVRCVCCCARRACTEPFLDRVCGAFVRVWVLASPANPGLDVGGIVFVCKHRHPPPHPAWGLRSVCRGTGFDFTPPILATVSGLCPAFDFDCS